MHFEQFGSVEGVVKIDGKEYSINTSGLRDHTVAAKRDWNDIHRYVLHFITLDNGNAITVGVVCMPVMYSRCNYIQFSVISSYFTMIDVVFYFH